MSKFVNYNKRGVTLPAGYHNLIDLLQPRKQHGMEGAASAEPQFDVARDSGIIKLSAIGGHVVQCFEARAKSASLTLRLPDESLGVSLTHMEEGFILASASLKEDSLR